MTRYVLVIGIGENQPPLKLLTKMVGDVRAIAQTFPQLTLEQIYATILYYLKNRTKIEQYLTNWLNYCTEAERAQDENSPEIVLKLRELKAISLVDANG